MSIEIIGKEAEQHLSWATLTDALEAGHRLPRAEIADTLLYRGKDTILDRAAWIDGLGALVKVATVHPDNAARGLAEAHVQRNDVAFLEESFLAAGRGVAVGDGTCRQQRSGAERQAAVGGALAPGALVRRHHHCGSKSVSRVAGFALSRRTARRSSRASALRSSGRR